MAKGDSDEEKNVNFTITTQSCCFFFFLVLKNPTASLAPGFSQTSHRLCVMLFATGSHLSRKLGLCSQSKHFHFFFNQSVWPRLKSSEKLRVNVFISCQLGQLTPYRNYATSKGQHIQLCLTILSKIPRSLMMRGITTTAKKRQTFVQLFTLHLFSSIANVWDTR